MRWKLLATVVPMGLAAAGLVAQTVLFAKGATTPLAAVLVMCIFVGSWRLADAGQGVGGEIGPGEIRSLREELLSSGIRYMR